MGFESLVAWELLGSFSCLAELGFHHRRESSLFFPIILIVEFFFSLVISAPCQAVICTFILVANVMVFFSSGLYNLF